MNQESSSCLPEIPEKYTQEYIKLLKKLEFGNERTSIKLKKIYAFMEDFASFVATFSVCGKGCSFCCHQHVYLTEFEARYIEQNTGRQCNAEKRVATTQVSGPCPFLDQAGACTIYESRPFHCRTYHTLDDPKFCETGEEHYVFGSNNGEYTVSFYKHFSQIIHAYNRNNPALDIRDFFGSRLAD